MTRELEENLVTYSPDFQNTSEPSNASTSVVNAPREPYVVKQDNGSFIDEIIFDLNRAPDSPNQFQCFHCKDVLRDGEACKRCTCAKCGSGLSKGFCYICGHNQNSLNNSPRISETSLQSPPNINHCCYECGDLLDGIICKRCTCKYCGKDAHIGYNCPSKVLVISIPEPCNNQTINELPQALPIFHPTFHSEAESPFTLDSTPTYVDESPNVFHPPRQASVYPCEFCGNDAYYGHYYTPQAPLIYPEPCYNQDFNFPQNFQNVPQQDLYTTDYCCSVGILEDKIICDLDKTPDLSQRSPQNCPKCGHPVNGHYCQGCAHLQKKFKEDLFTSCIEHGILQDSFEPSNDNSNVVNAPREPFVVNQDPSKNSSQSPLQINHHCCYGCGDPLKGIFCRQCTCELCGNGAHYGYNCPPKVSIIPNPEPLNNLTIEDLPPTVQSFDPKSDLVHDYPNVFDPPLQLSFIPCEFCGNDARYGHYCTPQVLFVHPKPCYNQDFNFSKEFHHFQQQDLCCENCGVTHEAYHESDGEPECDMPVCEAFTTFSNILFDSDYDFYSSDDQSFFDEDLPKEIYLNPLFDEEIIPMKIDPHHFNAESDLIESMLNHNSSIIISSKIDSLFDEFAGKLTLVKSIPPGIDETDCHPEEETHFTKRLLYDNSSPRPPKEFVSENSDAEIESFSPSPIPVEDSDSLMDEIDLSFIPDYPMPPGIEDDDYDSKRDILILNELFSNDSLSLLKNESFHFDIPSSFRPHAKPPDGNIGILNVKMMGNISEQKVPMPRFMITLVPNQEKSPDLLSHQGREAF
nr:hypothetical protein [Tanacetum cinerariifolium]